MLPYIVIILLLAFAACWAARIARDRKAQGKGDYTEYFQENEKKK